MVPNEIRFNYIMFPGEGGSDKKYWANLARRGKFWRRHQTRVIEVDWADIIWERWTLGKIIRASNS